MADIVSINGKPYSIGVDLASGPDTSVYGCPKCPFESDTIGAFRKHVEQEHPEPRKGLAQ